MGLELRGVGALHGRLQRSAVQGRVRGGGDDRPQAWGNCHEPRGLHGWDSGSASEEEDQPRLLCLKCQQINDKKCFVYISLYIFFTPLILNPVCRPNLMNFAINTSNSVSAR